MLSGPRALASASETSDYLLHEYLVRNDKAHRTANRWHGGERRRWVFRNG